MNDQSKIALGTIDRAWVFGDCVLGSVTFHDHRIVVLLARNFNAQTILSPTALTDFARQAVGKSFRAKAQS
jgi:hypothetical protein